MEAFFFLFLVIAVPAGAYYSGLVIINLVFLLVPGFKNRFNAYKKFAAEHHGTFKKTFNLNAFLDAPYEDGMLKIRMYFAKYATHTEIELFKNLPIKNPIEIPVFYLGDEYKNAEFDWKIINDVVALAKMSKLDRIVNLKITNEKVSVLYDGWLGKDGQTMIWDIQAVIKILLSMAQKLSDDNE